MSNPLEERDFKFLYSVIDENSAKLEDFYSKFKEKLVFGRNLIEELETETDVDKEEALLVKIQELEDEINDLIESAWI